MKTQKSASRLLNDIQAMKGEMKEAWSSIREEETETAAGVRAPKKNALMCNEYLRKKAKATKRRRQRSCAQRPRPKRRNRVAQEGRVSVKVCGAFRNTDKGVWAWAHYTLEVPLSASHSCHPEREGVPLTLQGQRRKGINSSILVLRLYLSGCVEVWCRAAGFLSVRGCADKRNVSHKTHQLSKSPSMPPDTEGMPLLWSQFITGMENTQTLNKSHTGPKTTQSNRENAN